MAVGSFPDHDSERLMALRLAGNTWTCVNVPSVGGMNATFTGIVCTAVNVCIGVGRTSTSTDREPFAARWNGTGWTSQSTPDSLNNGLYGISCVSVSNCRAVGFSWSAPAVDHWNGSTWTADTLQSGLEGNLSGISCVSVSNCVAVGTSATSAPLALRWNGSMWSSTASPIAGVPSAIDCPAANSCLAVGAFSDPYGNTQLVAERFDGATWSAVTTAPAFGDADTQLFGVTCLNPSYCVAVGSYVDPVAHVGRTLVERWNGSTWTVVPAANGGGNLGTELDGAYRNSATDCYAFGVSMGTSTTTPILEHWNGSAWSLVSVPLPAGVGGRFHGIGARVRRRASGR